MWKTKVAVVDSDHAFGGTGKHPVSLYLGSSGQAAACTLGKMHSIKAPGNPSVTFPSTNHENLIKLHHSLCFIFFSSGKLSWQLYYLPQGAYLRLDEAICRNRVA